MSPRAGPPRARSPRALGGHRPGRGSSSACAVAVVSSRNASSSAASARASSESKGSRLWGKLRLASRAASSRSPSEVKVCSASSRSIQCSWNPGGGGSAGSSSGGASRAGQPEPGHHVVAVDEVARLADGFDEAHAPPDEGRGGAVRGGLRAHARAGLRLRQAHDPADSSTARRGPDSVARTTITPPAVCPSIAAAGAGRRARGRARSEGGRRPAGRRSGAPRPCPG